MKSIEIIVGPTGQTRLATKGFTGATCRDASRFLEQALGNAISETLTSEFHQAERQQQFQTEKET